MSKDTVLLYTSCCAGFISIVAFVLHLAVLYLLRKVKRGSTNQKLLITNLSLAEAVFVPFSAMYYFRLLWTTRDTLANDLITIGFVAFAVNCYLANAFMMLDRTIAGLMPLRYRTLFTNGRVKAIVIALWVPFLLVPIPYFTHGYETFVISMVILTLHLDAALIVNSIFCYLAVLIKVNKRKKTFNQGDGNHGLQRASVRQRQQIFKVAVPVVLSFFLLVTIPDVASLILSLLKLDPVRNRKLLYTIPSLNLLLDPVLFLYTYPPLRQQLLKAIGTKRDGLSNFIPASQSSTVISSHGSNPAFAPNNVYTIPRTSYDTKL